VLYVLLCGQPPYSGPPEIVLFNVLNTPLVPPSKVNPNPKVPTALEAICLKAMAKEPGKRFTDCRQMADALRWWLEDQKTEGAKRKPKSAREEPTANRAWWREKPVLLVGAGVAALLVLAMMSVVALLLSVWSKPSEKREPMIVKGTPKEIEAFERLLTLAKQARKEQRYADAEKALEQALRLRPDNEAAEHLLELVHRDKRDAEAKLMQQQIELVWIPPGKFLMGTPPTEIARLKNQYGDWVDREGPQHEVEISKGFYLGKYEVTQAEYETMIGVNPSHFSAKGGGTEQVQGKDTSRFPVESVSWRDAKEFCRKLTEHERRLGRLGAKEEYRLPTEAEWEYACRGGVKKHSAFHYGDSLSATQANFHGDYPYGGGAKRPYLGRTERVGSYKANEFGLHDMHGNVWEWCEDWYNENEYLRGNCKDPRGPLQGFFRVMRGGGWSTIAHRCRSADRDSTGPEGWRGDLGFRVVRSSVE
jgi:formylglycine-generating enzyme required for sulfatase activity